MQRTSITSISQHLINGLMTELIAALKMIENIAFFWRKAEERNFMRKNSQKFYLKKIQKKFPEKICQKTSGI